MRAITNHQLTLWNEAIKIEVLDEPVVSSGGHHKYRITANNGETEVSAVELNFQNGPVLEYGINGITDASLLAVVIDRLRSFQSGAFSCRENALALTKLEEALYWLHHRTLERQARGVEGTLAV